MVIYTQRGRFNGKFSGEGKTGNSKEANLKNQLIGLQLCESGTRFKNWLWTECRYYNGYEDQFLLD